MNWIGWMFLAISIVYLGNIFGCMILCETIPGLESAKKYAWIIPMVNIMLLFSFLFDSSVKNRFTLFKKFVTMPQKNIFSLKALARSTEKAIADDHRYSQFYAKRKARQQRRVAVLEGTVKYCGAALSAEYR